MIPKMAITALVLREICIGWASLIVARNALSLVVSVDISTECSPGRRVSIMWLSIRSIDMSDHFRRQIVKQ